MKRAAPWLPAAALILLQFLNGLRGLPQLAFLVIYLEEQLHLSPVAISGVVSGAQAVGMVMALLGGAAGAWLGSKRVLLLGLAVSAVASLALQAGTPAAAALLWIAGGAGWSLVTVGGASYLTRISARGASGMLSAFYALATSVGGALGNPAAGLLIERSGYAALSWAGVALTAAAVLVAAAGLGRLDAPSPEDEAAPRSPGLALFSAARHPAMRRLIFLRALPTLYYGVLTVLIPLLLNDLTGSKVLVAAYGTTTLVVASAAQLITGRAADRWGALRPGQAAYAVILFSGVGLALSTGTVGGVYVFGVLGNAAAWSLSTLLYVWVGDGVPRADHPAAFGLLHAVWSLSMIAGSVLAGGLAEALPGAAFLAAALLNLGSFVLLASFYQRREPPGEAAPG